LPTPHRATYDWSREMSLLGRAVVLAGDKLVVAGPPDVVDTEQTFQRYGDPEAQKQLARQSAAMRDELGALLEVVSTEDGRTLSRLDLASQPVFDGMIAAGGSVYLATMDGRVVCLQ
jgi:hypothetical protein